MKKTYITLLAFIFVGLNIANAQLSGKKISLDPGHGGTDIGAPGVDGSGFPNEEDLVLEAGLELRNRFQNAGAEVTMTRTSDWKPSLYARRDHFSEENPDAAISIHLNSNEKESAHGTQAFYYHNSALASDLQDALAAETGLYERDLTQAGFVVIKCDSSIPATLTEGCFLSNNNEFNFITSAAGKEKWITAHEKGVYNFFDITYTGGTPARPTLHAVLNNNSQKGVSLSWAQNGESDLAGYRLYYSDDDNLDTWALAANENTLGASSTYVSFNDPSEFLVPTTGDPVYFKLTALNTSNKESENSDIYARSSVANGSGMDKILVVDGFDRSTGSWSQQWHSFNTMYFKSLRTASSNGVVISSCANELVADGTIPMSNYDMVIWFVGDESTTLHTFYATEQTKIKEYLENGGKLLVSGSEIGWDLYNKGDATDQAFYNDYFKANFASDGSSGTNPASGIEGSPFQGAWLNFGQTYTEDYPDELTPNGGIAIMNYNNNNNSAVAYTGTFGSSTTEGQVVYVAFPLETVSPLSSLDNFMTKLLAYFDTGKPKARIAEILSPTLINTSISFDASASSDNGSITSYAWNFGDGTTATGVNTSHAYTTAGDYTISLTVTDNEENTATATAQVTIVDCLPPAVTEVVIDNVDATLVGSWYESTSTAGFNGTNYIHDGGTSQDGWSATFTPDFEVSGIYEVFIFYTAGTNRATNTPVDINHADGTTTKAVNQQENHITWVSLGEYTFYSGNTIVVRNDGADQVVIVDAVKLVYKSCVPNPNPIANFAASSTGVCQNEQVTFTNNSQAADSYSWTFEGGSPSSSTQLNPVVTYNTSGTFDVALVASNVGSGEQDTKTVTDMITVNPLVGAAAIPSGPVNLDENATNTNYTTTGAANASSYIWTIEPTTAGTISGTGTTATVDWNDTFTGTATIKVTGTNSCGNGAQSEGLTVTISSTTPPPTADFTFDKAVVMEGGVITFANQSANEATYSWTFNGGTPATSTNENPVITYSTAGVYDVTLTVTGSTGLTDTKTITGAITVTNDQVDVPSICYVSTNTATQKNVVNWEKAAVNSIASYNIYKETYQADVYELVGNVAYADNASFEDANSNPATMAYRYKISAVDLEGNETAQSDLHKTIHLTINAGQNGAWNLIWDNYVGFPYATYKIYRGTSATDMTLLAQVQASLNSYSDLTPPNGDVHYCIEIDAPNCGGTKSGNKNTGVRSNIVHTYTTGIADNLNFSFDVYPNPAMQTVNVRLSNEFSQNSVIDIYSLQGQKVISKKANYSNNTSIDISALARGTYIIKITDKDKIFVKRLIKK